MARTPGPRQRRGLPATPYERRIERNLAKGMTLPEARGHKPVIVGGRLMREHEVRRERERAAEARHEGLTTYHRAKVKQFAELQAKRANLDPEQVNDDYQRIARVHGYDAIREIRAEVAALGRLKSVRVRRRVKRGRGVKVIDISREVERAQKARDRSLARMERLSRAYGIDWRLLFYH
jgi:hypothetical protein